MKGCLFSFFVITWHLEMQVGENISNVFWQSEKFGKKNEGNIENMEFRNQVLFFITTAKKDKLKWKYINILQQGA